MEWFKFYGSEYLADPKMMSLSASERSCWVTLLSFAAVAEDNGRVKYLSEPQLMTAAGVSPMHEEWDDTVGVLDKFESMGMVLRESNGDLTVKNWGKRQESYMTNAERQKRYREKQKSNAEVTQPLQQSNARIEENRIEETSTEVQEITIVSEQPTNAGTRTRAKYPHAKEIFALFPVPQRSWTINTTELQYAEMLYERTVPRVKAALAFVEEHRDEEFFSKVVKPSDLEKKWLDILEYRKKHNL